MTLAVVWRAALACAALAACGHSKPVDGPAGGAVVLPPVNAPFDYQLGGAYAPAAGVKVVSRPHDAMPANGIYNICYVNGFQIQHEDATFWQTQHPDLILRDASGNPVIDPNWNEMLIDVSTADKRSAVAAVIDGWIDGCQQAGFDALELDNLDSYTRSEGLLTADDNVAAMRTYADRAHADGMAASQKNAADLVARKAELGTDFAIVEECNQDQECPSFVAGYGDHVLVIEYTQPDFDADCQGFPQLSIVLRDTNLVTPSQAGYVYAGC